MDSKTGLHALEPEEFRASLKKAWTQAERAKGRHATAQYRSPGGGKLRSGIFADAQKIARALGAEIKIKLSA